MGSKPDTPAFQDEFTREFMKSSEEVEDGYYEFESKTGGYTMLFPVTGEMQKSRYFYDDETGKVEDTLFIDSDDDILRSVRTRYDARARNADDIEARQRSLSRSVSYEGEYEEIEADGKTIYYAKNEYHVQVEDKEGTSYSFFGYVKSNEHSRGLSLAYEVSCRDKAKPCDLDLDLAEERAKKLMKAVQFKQKSVGSEE
ncbi:hypothetical protein NSQ26_14155 [Bacillus sp. FSL W7-1360]